MREYAKVLGSNLDGALSAWDEFSERYQITWDWSLALLPNGEVRVHEQTGRDRSILEAAAADLVVPSAAWASALRHARREAANEPRWRSKDTWVAEAWRAVCVAYQIPVEEHTRFMGNATPFLERVRQFIIDQYRQLKLPDHYTEPVASALHNIHYSHLRKELVEVFESCYRNGMQRDEFPHMPFLELEHLDQWPAHFVGPARCPPDEPAVFLLLERFGD